MLKFSKTVPTKPGYYWIRRKSAIPSDNIEKSIHYLKLISTIPYSCVKDQYIDGIGWINMQQPIEFAGPIEEPL